MEPRSTAATVSGVAERAFFLSIPTLYSGLSEWAQNTIGTEGKAEIRARLHPGILPRPEELARGRARHTDIRAWVRVDNPVSSTAKRPWGRNLDTCTT